jgi:hypothetical protein
VLEPVRVDGHRADSRAVHADEVAQAGMPLAPSDTASPDYALVDGSVAVEGPVIATDPRTGIVYLTEDDRNKSGFYRFIPNRRAGSSLAGKGAVVFEGSLEDFRHAPEADVFA